MTRLQRYSVLVLLIDELRSQGSWCGETHVQKAVYLLQELASMPLGFPFILYKHGPYSFELTDELTAMTADGLLEVVAQRAPYGPSLLTTTAAHTLVRLHPHTTGKYTRTLQDISRLIGNRGVAELERLATSLYVTREMAGTTVEQRAHRVVELKPHITDSDAISALNEVDRWLRASKT